MLRNDYNQRVEQLSARAELLEQGGRHDAAELINFRIQELDFEYHPELAGPRPEEIMQ